VLLVGFTIAISVSLLRGRKPNCRCFGGIAAAPIGKFTLARNAAFISAAGFIVTEGWMDVGPSAADLLTSLSLGQAAAAGGALTALFTLIAQTWFLIQLLQQQGRIILRLDGVDAKLESGAPGTALSLRPTPQPPNGLPIGSTAPAFKLSGVYGETLTLAALSGTGKPVLLVFVDPDCGPCTALLPELAQWQRGLVSSVVIALIGRGTEEVNRAKIAAHGLVQVLLQTDNEVAETYRVKGTPSAVLVGSNGAIASPVAEGADAIRALVERTGHLIPVPSSMAASPLRQPNSNGDARCPDCGQQYHRGNGYAIPPANIGVPAPAVSLPDLNGNVVDLAEFRGFPTVAVFWQPSCHFCQELLPELRAWENSRPEGVVRLLVISNGTLEENSRLGFRSPVLLAPDFSVGSAFGVNGTPSAVLLDEEGRISSPVAVGGPAVLALAKDTIKARPTDNGPAATIN
jgi:peroxiredoxin